MTVITPAEIKDITKISARVAIKSQKAKVIVKVKVRVHTGQICHRLVSGKTDARNNIPTCITEPTL